MSLAGRRAVVTGASSGIGSAIARSLASEGVELLVAGRDRKRLDEIASQVGARAVAGDLAKSSDAELLAAAAAGSSILVNAAGIYAGVTTRKSSRSSCALTSSLHTG